MILMLSTIVKAEYADVFLESSPNQTLVISGVVIGALGLLIMLVGGFSTFNAFEIMMTGMIIICVGGAVASSALVMSDSNKVTIQKNMISNVQDKYHADLKVSSDQIKDLDKFQNYTLTFDNGAEGQYRIRFEKTGEPILAETTSAPTAEQLNEDTIKTTPSAKPAPTASELEKSAQK